MGRSQATGSAAETAALGLLQGSGLTLVERNYRCRRGEIDLIMRDADALVFVEVRYRRHGGFGGPLASIDGRKQQRLLAAARHYLAQTRWEGPCRFDVVGLGGGDAEWITDAFGD